MTLRISHWPILVLKVTKWWTGWIFSWFEASIWWFSDRNTACLGHTSTGQVKVTSTYQNEKSKWKPFQRASVAWIEWRSKYGGFGTFGVLLQPKIYARKGWLYFNWIYWPNAHLLPVSIKTFKIICSFTRFRLESKPWYRFSLALLNYYKTIGKNCPLGLTSRQTRHLHSIIGFQWH